jgi:hypothetical protein
MYTGNEATRNTGGVIDYAIAEQRNSGISGYTIVERC